jgi:thiol:disulfide interchange protein
VSSVNRPLLLVALVLSLTAACRNRTRTDKARAAQASAALSDPALPSGTALTSGALRPRFVPAPAQPSSAQPFIREQLQNASETGERVLVYVGASWCEPCQRFHHAVEQGELDGLLANTRLLAFDADSDTAALREAGYAFRLIPLIAVPNADGRSSGRQLSGSIKGPDAVARDLVPRLTSLLAGKEVK